MLKICQFFLRFIIMKFQDFWNRKISYRFEFAKKNQFKNNLISKNTHTHTIDRFDDQTNHSKVTRIIFFTSHNNNNNKSFWIVFVVR